MIDTIERDELRAMGFKLLIGSQRVELHKVHGELLVASGVNDDKDHREQFERAVIRYAKKYEASQRRCERP